MKTAFRVVLPTVILLAVAYALFAVSRSRTFQFFSTLTPRVNTTRKVVALTFDDAPSEHSDEVLDILDRKRTKATFYVIGGSMERYPAEAKKIADAGHEIGNHSYSHTRMVLKTPAYIAREIERTDALIRKTGYTGPITFRPPNGKKLFFLPWYLRGHGIRTVMWDIEPDTYAPTGSGREAFIVDYTLSRAKPGSIILMHPFCGTACEADRQALPKIIDGLRKLGLTPVTVSELLDAEGK